MIQALLDCHLHDMLCACLQCILVLQCHVIALCNSYTARGLQVGLGTGVELVTTTCT